MSDIYWIFLEAFDTGWLSLESEKKIQERSHVELTWNRLDIKIMDDLRQAVEDGRVKREALENLASSQVNLTAGNLSEL